MDKIYKYPPWWSYFVSIGFILFGIWMVKFWKSSRNPYATLAEQQFTEWPYLISGITSIVGGIMFLLMSIYQDCTGGVK